MLFRSLRAGLGKAMRNYIDTHNLSPKGVTLTAEDIREGRTGLSVIDKTVHTLYETGYLHNHARMWLASYVVHLRKIHWRVGADWLYAHLLDGDLASNHLSWQWVAATFSSKPYLFNAENVAKYAPADWHCPRSAIDISYETLEAIARSAQVVPASQTLIGVEEPLVGDAPAIESSPLSVPAGSCVRLVHPWMLDHQTFDGLRVGVIHLPFHKQFPWSSKRWDFLMQRLPSVTDALFIGDLNDLRQVLDKAAHVESVQTLNPGYRERLPALCTQLREVPRRFPNPEKPCRSFSAFWSICTQGDESAPRRSWHR